MDTLPLYHVGQIIKFKSSGSYKIITGRNWDLNKHCYTYLVSDLPKKAIAYDEDWLDILVDHSVTGCYQDAEGTLLKAGDHLEK